MTAEREAMTLAQVRDYLRAKAVEGRLSDRYVGVLRKTATACADAIDAHLSRAAEPVGWLYRFTRFGPTAPWHYTEDERAATANGAEKQPLFTHPPEPARGAATKALAALGHVRKPNERCIARYAEVPKEERPPGPANVPVWCCLRAGHEGPHKCSHYGMHPPFVMRTDQTVMGDPLPDVCSKCGTRWPCPDAASVIAAMAQESGE